MKKRIVNIVFTVIFTAVFTLGFVTALTSGKKINEYENRNAESVKQLSVESFMDLSFQDSMELALSDKVNYAEEMKKLYNDTTSAILKSMVGLFTRADETGGYKYVKIGEMNLIGEDYIVFNTSVFDYLKALLEERAEMYNSLVAQNSDTEFYVYYVEKDTDINFETNEKVGVFEHLKKHLKIDGEKVARFEINSFDEFKNYFFRTDHHWNEAGAHKGYTEVLKLLSPEEKPLEYNEKIKIADGFSGSKAQGETAGYSEEFFAYRYNFVPMKTTINGMEASDYGKRALFNSGEGEKVSYSEYYGPDMGEVILDTQNNEKENLLIIGESYDNAILKLIAGHFHKTYSVDLRYYEVYMQKKFNLGEYIKANDIDKVLFMGNVDYMILEEFRVEG